VGRYTLHVDPPEDPTLESRAEPVTLGITVALHLESEMADLSGDERCSAASPMHPGRAFLRFDEFNATAAVGGEPREAEPAGRVHAVGQPVSVRIRPGVFVGGWALRKKFGLA
jgi:hypothetical protein